MQNDKSYTSYKWNGTKVTHFVIKCQVTKATSFVDIYMQWQKLKFVDKNEKQPMLNTWWRKWKITKVNKGDTSDKGQTFNSLRHRWKVPKITQSVIQVKREKIKKKYLPIVPIERCKRTFGAELLHKSGDFPARQRSFLAHSFQIFQFPSVHYQTSWPAEVDNPEDQQEDKCYLD